MENEHKRDYNLRRGTQCYKSKLERLEILQHIAKGQTGEGNARLFNNTFRTAQNGLENTILIYLQDLT